MDIKGIVIKNIYSNRTKTNVIIQLGASGSCILEDLTIGNKRKWSYCHANSKLPLLIIYRRQMRTLNHYNV